MEKNNFYEKLKIEAEKLEIKLDEEQLKKFYKYMELLIEWNKKINLTAIIEPKEVITKHFIDSLTILKYIDKNASIVDVGTGAGFPGIPLKISNHNLKVTLIDSLNKRIIFLNEVIEKLELKKIKAIHSRAEEFGKNKDYRESYDIAVSRAVARLNILAEYLLPIIKIGGKCICMKGPDTQEEIDEAKTAINVLGGEIEEIKEFALPGTEIKRTVIIINKIKSTPNKFPRKAGTPTKEPIK